MSCTGRCARSACTGRCAKDRRRCPMPPPPPPIGGRKPNKKGKKPLIRYWPEKGTKKAQIGKRNIIAPIIENREKHFPTTQRDTVHHASPSMCAHVCVCVLSRRGEQEPTYRSDSHRRGHGRLFFDVSTEGIRKTKTQHHPPRLWWRGCRGDVRATVVLLPTHCCESRWPAWRNREARA